MAASTGQRRGVGTGYGGGLRGSERSHRSLRRWVACDDSQCVGGSRFDSEEMRLKLLTWRSVADADKEAEGGLRRWMPVSGGAAMRRAGVGRWHLEINRSSLVAG